jgi:translation elongation factor EF-1alpha
VTVLQVTTLLDYLNDVVELPERDTAKPLRVPISGIYKIKGAHILALA